MSDRWGDSQRDRDELDAWITRAQEDGEYGELEEDEDLLEDGDIEPEDVDYLEDLYDADELDFEDDEF
jgi:hypothetical protein